MKEREGRKEGAKIWARDRSRRGPKSREEEEKVGEERGWCSQEEMREEMGKKVRKVAE